MIFLLLKTTLLSLKSFHCWNHFESLWSTTPISSLQHETQEREPLPSLVQLWINRDQTLSKRRCVNRKWSFRSNHHSLVGFKHSGVVVSWFGGEIASLPQLRGSSVRPCVTDIYLLLHGLHTLQRQHVLLLQRRSHLKGWNLGNLWMLCCLSWPERWPWMHRFGPVFLHLWWRTQRSAWPSSLRPPHLPWSSSRCRYDSPPRDPVVNMPTQHSQWG